MAFSSAPSGTHHKQSVSPESSTVGPEGDAPVPNDGQPSNVPKFPNSSRRQFKERAKKDNSGENKGDNNQKKSPRNSFQEDVGFDGSINQQGGAGRRGGRGRRKEWQKDHRQRMDSGSDAPDWRANVRYQLYSTYIEILIILYTTKLSIR